MAEWQGVGVPPRVAQYVESLFERLRFNVEHDLPLTMGSDPGAFLAWMGMPPRDPALDRKAMWGSLVGPKAAAQRERVRAGHRRRKQAKG